MHQESITPDPESVINLLHELDAIVWEGDAKLEQLRFVSRQAAALLGYPLEQWLKPGFLQRLIHIDDRQRFLQLRRTAAEQGKGYELQFRAVTADGRVLWLRDTARYVPDVEGGDGHFRGIMVDISGLRHNQEIFRESHHILQSTLDGLTAHIAILSEEGLIIDVNRAWFRFAEANGLTMPDYGIGANYLTVCDAAAAAGCQDAEGVARGIRDILAGRLQEYHHEYGCHSPQERRWFVVHITPVSVTNKARLVVAHESVTERKLIEGALQQSNETLSALLEAVPVAIAALDLEGRIQFCNPAAGRILGWNEPEVLNQRPPLLDEPDGEEFRQLLARSLGGERISGVERRARNKEGAEIHVGIWTAALRDYQTRIIGSLWVIVDVTERVRSEEERASLEEKLRLAHKMDAIGRLAGSIAHDFNNLLTVIGGYAKVMLDQTAPAEPMHAGLQQIAQATDRAAGLTRQLLVFGRRQAQQPAVLDWGAILSEMEDLLNRLLRNDIALTLRIAPNLSSVRADRAQLEQVIVNLAANARDAMPSGGELRIELANVEVGGSSPAPHPALQPGSFVMLSVTDSGLGMDEAVRSRVFEPFFSTKQKSKASGLGLATVYGIVKQSHGEVWLATETGRGTTFHVCLPAVVGALPAPTPAEPAHQPSKGHETILLVEDESGVRRLVETILQSKGYQVISAGNGAEALDLCESLRQPIDLLLSDVVMPHLNGPDLAERLRPRQPDMRVLFMSGYTDAAVYRQGIEESGAPFLQKPFRPEELLRRIRELLSRPTS